MSHWDAIEADFQEHYGIDLESGVMRSRTWRWFTVRITGLFTRPPVYRGSGEKPLAGSRLARAMTEDG